MPEEQNHKPHILSEEQYDITGAILNLLEKHNAITTGEDGRKIFQKDAVRDAVKNIAEELRHLKVVYDYGTQNFIDERNGEVIQNGASDMKEALAQTLNPDKVMHAAKHENHSTAPSAFFSLGDRLSTEIGFKQERKFEKLANDDKDASEILRSFASLSVDTGIKKLAKKGSDEEVLTALIENFMSSSVNPKMNSDGKFSEKELNYMEDKINRVLAARQNNVTSSRER